MKTALRKVLPGVLAFLLLAAVSPPLAADADTARARYSRASAAIVAKGYRQTRFEDLEEVAEGRAIVYPVVLERNVKYALYAAKDENIDALELVITPEEGDSILARSTASDWGASLFFVPPSTGLYKAYVRNTKGRSGFYVAAVAF
jgi:hypothetical protein